MSPRKMIFGAFLAGVSVFLLLYDTQGLLPLLSVQFHCSPALASLTIAGPTLGLAAGFIPMSHCASVYGRRKTVILSLFSAGILGLALAYAPNIPILIILRTVEGVVLAGVPAAMMAYLAEELPKEKSVSAIGTYLSGNALGGLGSRFISGWIAQYFQWRISLGCIALLALLCALLFILYVPMEQYSSQIKRSIFISMKITLEHFRTRYIKLMCIYGSMFMLIFGSSYTMLSYRLTRPPYHLLPGEIGSFFLLYLVGLYLAPRVGILQQKIGISSLGLSTSLICICGICITLTNSLLLITLGLFCITCSFFIGNSTAASQISLQAHTNKPQASALYLTCYYLASAIGNIISAWAYMYLGWLGVCLICCIAAFISIVSISRITQISLSSKI